MKTLYAGLSAAVFALSIGAASAEEAFEQKVKVMAGETLYKEQCRRCHAPDADHASYGPLLENIIGRTAGSVEDYDYSDALSGAGFVWTEGALRAWMEDNTGLPPRNQDAPCRHHR